MQGEPLIPLIYSAVPKCRPK